MYRRKVIFIAITAILFSSVAQAEKQEGLIQKAHKADRETTGEDAKTTVYNGVYKGMSKPEIIQEIKDEVHWDEEILEKTPKLKRQKDKDGKDVYSYLIAGKQINLEDVDEKILRALVEQVDTKSDQLTAQTTLELQANLKMIAASRRPPQVPSRPPSVPKRPPASTQK